MESQWLIVGISGVTCGGKTTLTKQLMEILPNSKILSQDDYFHPKDSGKHILIPELNHFNWEVLSSLDMERMYNDIKQIVGEHTIQANIKMDEWSKQIVNGKNILGISKNELNLIQNKLKKHKIRILIVEGFSIFNYVPIDIICQFKFYLTLTRATCATRRNARTYDPPDVPGYFDKIVWPEYLRQLKEVQEKSENIVYLPEQNHEKFSTIMKYLLLFFQTLT